MNEARITPWNGCIYQTDTSFPDHLAGELAHADSPLRARPAGDQDTQSPALPGAAQSATLPGAFGPFFAVEGPLVQTFWHRNVWLEPFIVEFDSISQAARALKDIQRNWAPALYTSFRRGELVRDKLPYINTKTKTFPWLLPESPMGAYTLLDDHLMVASARCSSPFPGGILDLAEDKVNPPSRAYRKLQEALILARRWPQTGERCLDAGACPGGWTWVLDQLGASVLAVDRSPLDERLMDKPNIEFLAHDAFTLKPADIGPFDWIFSDVICYPSRLLEWVRGWLDSGLCKNFICTIKMQGDWDRETTRAFASIPGSFVVHLNNNKHELCWIKVE